MDIGYARISKSDQKSNLQEDALKANGCEQIIIDKVSGTVSERPGLIRIKDILRSGDTLVVWRLDRLGRSLKDLIDWINYLDANGISFRSLNDAVDTRTPSGKLIFHIFGAIAEFERNLIEERTKAGLIAARARGKLGGRPKSLKVDKRHVAVDLYRHKKHSIKQICEMMGISKPTLYTYIREDQESLKAL